MRLNTKCFILTSFICFIYLNWVYHHLPRPPHRHCTESNNRENPLSDNVIYLQSINPDPNNLDGSCTIEDEKVDCLCFLQYNDSEPFYTWKNDIVIDYHKHRNSTQLINVGVLLYRIFKHHNKINPDKRFLFLDAGANSGFYSQVAASHGYRAVAMESKHSCQERLRSSVRVTQQQLGIVHRIDILGTLLGSKMDLVQFIEEGNCDHFYTTSDKRESYKNRSYTLIKEKSTMIPMISLATVIHSLQSMTKYHYTVMKIDVQCMEADVLGPLALAIGIGNVQGPDEIIVNVSCAKQTLQGTFQHLIQLGYRGLTLPLSSEQESPWTQCTKAEDMYKTGVRDVWLSRTSHLGLSKQQQQQQQ